MSQTQADRAPARRRSLDAPAPAGDGQAEAGSITTAVEPPCPGCHELDWESVRARDGFDWSRLTDLLVLRRRHQVECSLRGEQ